MKVDDVCALTLCGHRRDNHRHDPNEWVPLGRACMVAGCPCARFVEPSLHSPGTGLREEITSILTTHEYTRWRRDHDWWMNRLRLALMETAAADGVEMPDYTVTRASGEVIRAEEIQRASRKVVNDSSIEG